MHHSIPRVLPFEREREVERSPIGRIHRDGSISFRGRTYASIKEVPPDCRALLPDQETYKEWKRLYRAIRPRGGARTRRPYLTLVE